MIKLTPIILIFSFIFSQEGIEDHIQNVLNGDAEDARSLLTAFEENYPNNSAVMFLSGLLEPDGEKAMKVFKEIYANHPSSDYGDDAVMKVSEYYYAAGLYVQAANWLKKMPLYYSRSEHIERAVKLFLNSLVVSGHRDTAIFYSQVFSHQFPKLDVDGKIADLLKDYEESKKAEAEAKRTQSQEEIQKVPVVEFEERIEPIPTKIIIKEEGRYSLQIGAYSVRKNAEKQRILLINNNFSARIKELYRGDRILFAVCSGYYNSKEDAKRAGIQIKSRMGIDSIVITNDQLQFQGQP